jgi:hypothetical protein
MRNSLNWDPGRGGAGADNEEFAEPGSWPGMAAGERADRQMQRPIPKGCRGNYTLIGYLTASCVFFHPATGAMLACVDGSSS